MFGGPSCLPDMPREGMASSRIIKQICLFSNTPELDFSSLVKIQNGLLGRVIDWIFAFTSVFF